MANPIERIYFAGPWFNPAQVERYEAVLAILKNWWSASPGRSVYVPREHPCPEVSDPRTRSSVYAANIVAIENASKVVAITDEKDLGTIFELGYAARLRDERTFFERRPELIGVALSLGDQPFNLMLAVGLDETCRTLGELRGLLLEGRSPGRYEGKIE